MLENYENIIIYGLGQSGISSYERLKDRKNIFIWDDCEKKRKELEKKGYEFNEPRKWPWEKIDLLISSPGIALNFGANSFIVKESIKNKIKIVGDIEVFHQELKSLGIRKKIIAVTGTNGKSTFVSVLNEILQKSGLKSCIAGNIGIPVLSLNADEFDIIIIELSSFQLELIDEFRADISVLLNVFEDHNERYGSYEVYQKTKTKIFLNQRNSDHAIFDDFYLSEKVLKEINPSPKHVLFKDNEFNDLSNKISQNGIIKKFLPALIKVTDILDIDRNFVINQLKKFKSLNHRIYEVCSKNGVSFINDSKATNPAAANFAASQFKDIYWILGGLSKNNDLTKLNLSNKNIKKIFLIGSSSDQLSQIIPKKVKFEVSHNLENATKSAYTEVLKNQKGCILLSPGCSSQDQFIDYQERGNKFTKIVNNLVVKC